MNRLSFVLFLSLCFAIVPFTSAKGSKIGGQLECDRGSGNCVAVQRNGQRDRQLGLADRAGPKAQLGRPAKRRPRLVNMMNGTGASADVTRVERVRKSFCFTVFILPFFHEVTPPLTTSTSPMLRSPASLSFPSRAPLCLLRARGVPPSAIAHRHTS